jgi:sugar lactone lactonase YvrE
LIRLVVAALVVGVGCSASSTSAGGEAIRPVRVPRAAVVGVAWRALLAAATPPTITATGPERLQARGRRVSSRRYRVTLTFPRAGRWTLSARAGRGPISLGAVTVDIRPTPLLGDLFALATEPNGTLLVGQVHGGGIVRATLDGSTTRVLPNRDVFHISVGRSGTAYVTLHDNGGVYRLDARNELEPLGLPPDAAIAVEGPGAVYALHGNRLLRRTPDGHVATAAGGFSSPLGLAASDDALFVGNTGRGTIERVDPETGVRSTVAHDLGYVVSVATAPDGVIWSSSSADSGSPGVWRTTPDGISTRLLAKEVSAVALGGDGAVYASVFRERRILRLDPVTGRWEPILRAR